MIYENAWYDDGSLRDIYVLNATIQDWQRIVDWLRTNPYPVEFHLDDQLAPLPDDVLSIFAHRNEIGVSLAINVSGVDIRSYFFWHKEIEFNIDPRQVDRPQKEEGIIDFMRVLGKLLGKEVILTPENWKVSPFLRYIPQSDELIHDADTSLEPIEVREISRAEGLKLMAKVYGVDENDEAAIIEKMLEAADRPAYPED